MISCFFSLIGFVIVRRMDPVNRVRAVDGRLAHVQRTSSVVTRPVGEGVRKVSAVSGVQDVRENCSAIDFLRFHVAFVVVNVLCLKS